MDRIFTLETTAYTLEQILTFPGVLPQIALAGRSNVGKSSLINALGGSKKLAKTSSTPGKTRSINFYSIRPADFYLVDLPGYGYARSSKEERRKWAAVIEGYLGRTPHLKALAILLDCRLAPQELDVSLVAFAVQSAIPLLAILTKADKCGAREQAARQAEWARLLPSGIAPLLVSAKTGKGLTMLWRALCNAAGVCPEAPCP